MLLFVILQVVWILFLFYCEINEISLINIVKQNALCCYEFLKGIGPNISAVSIVAVFIPINGVSVAKLVVVFVCGIIITMMADYAIRKAKESK